MLSLYFCYSPISSLLKKAHSCLQDILAIKGNSHIIIYALSYSITACSVFAVQTVFVPFQTERKCQLPLRYYLQLKDKQIAALFGKPRTTVNYRKNAALKQLWIEMEKMNNEE